ncbi:MAG: hypothetical protein ACXAEU_18815 [Candidatus Hodarchaeales archaeon]|jgi:hypothetical protein
MTDNYFLFNLRNRLFLRRSREESLFEITNKLGELKGDTDLEEAMRLEFEAWLSQDVSIVVEAIFAYLKARQVVTARELHCFLHEIEPESKILESLSNFKYTRDDCAWIIRGKEAQFNPELSTLLLVNWTAIDSCVESIDIVTPALAVFSDLSEEYKKALIAKITAPLFINYIDAFQKLRVTFDITRLLMKVKNPSDRIINRAVQNATDAMMVARQMPLIKPLMKTLLTHAEIIERLAERTDNPQLKEEYQQQAAREREEARVLRDSKVF